MKTLIIPDIHHKTFTVDEILNKEKDYDKVIFLGDYFDQFGDCAEEAEYVARWLKPKLWDKNFIFLWGNHDIHYAPYRNKRVGCSGWTYSKHQVINSVLDRGDWDRFKFFWQKDGWLFTHAGLHPSYLPPLWKKKDVTTSNIKEYLLEESKRCLIELDQEQGEHWFFRCGDSRREYPIGVDAGGILWCDVRREFEPIEGLRQIFGHTIQLPFPTLVASDLKRINSSECLNRNISPKNGWDIDLDCNLKYYGVLTQYGINIQKSPEI